MSCFEFLSKRVALILGITGQDGARLSEFMLSESREVPSA
jgi:GDP-D-mannose dehydratase